MEDLIVLRANILTHLQVIARRGPQLWQTPYRWEFPAQGEQIETPRGEVPREIRVAPASGCLWQAPYRWEFLAQGEQIETPKGEVSRGPAVATASGRPPRGGNSSRRASKSRLPGARSQGGLA